VGYHEISSQHTNTLVASEQGANELIFSSENDFNSSLVAEDNSRPCKIFKLHLFLDRLPEDQRSQSLTS